MHKYITGTLYFIFRITKNSIDRLDNFAAIFNGTLASASFRLNSAFRVLVGNIDMPHVDGFPQARYSTKVIVEDIPLVEVDSAYFSPLIDIVLNGPLNGRFYSKRHKDLYDGYTKQKLFTQLQAESLQQEVLAWLLTDGIALPVMPTDGELAVSFPHNRIIKRSYELHGNVMQPLVYRITYFAALSVMIILSACSALISILSAGMPVWFLPAYALSVLLLRVGLDRKDSLQFAHGLARNISAIPAYRSQSVSRKNLIISIFASMMLLPTVLYTGYGTAIALNSFLSSIESIPPIASFIISSLFACMVSMVTQMAGMAGLENFGVRFACYKPPSFDEEEKKVLSQRAMRIEAIDKISSGLFNLTDGLATKLIQLNHDKQTVMNKRLRRNSI